MENPQKTENPQINNSETEATTDLIAENTTNKPGWVDKYFKWIKIAIMVCAYGYLAYMLITFDQYDDFAASFHDISWERFVYLAACILFIPLNWGMESLKWKTLIQTIQDFPYSRAVKSVLIGLTGGFFTPNRIGEPIARTLLLNEGNRTKGVVLSFVGMFGQTFACFLYGSIAIICLIFSDEFSEQAANTEGWREVGFLLVFFFCLFYFSIPFWGNRLVKLHKFGKLRDVLRAISNVSYSILLKVTLYAIIRYGVYCSQLFFMLRFFSVDIPMTTAFMIIPLQYLVSSITPSVAFAEAGIRGAYAILLIGAFATNTVGAALAAMTVWVFNYVIPMLVGSYFLSREKKLR